MTSLTLDDARVYHVLVQHAREPILVVDRRGELQFANQAAARMFGDPDPDADQSLFEFVHPADVGRLRVAFDRALDDVQSSCAIEVRIRADDGDWRLIECTIRGLVDNVTLYGLVLMRDISALRHLSARLRHAQKLTKLGGLTVTIAKDLNDSLSTMRRHICTLMESETSPEALRFSLLAVKRCAEATAALSRQLLAFGYTAADVTESVDLHEMLTDLADTMRRIHGRAIWLQVSLAATRAVIRIEKENFDSAMMNLVTHMHETMPQAGAVTIGTRDIQVPGASTKADPSEFIVIEISNAGFDGGLDGEPHLFEPPFDPEGSMIALALVLLHDIVTAAGGFVEFSRDGAAIVIRVFLPVA